MLGLYGKGFVNYLYDEMELGERVACFLDAENNMPEIHFLDPTHTTHQLNCSC